MADDPKPLSPGQLAYEEKRAAKAGMSLEKWLAQKARDSEAAARAQAREAKQAAKAKKAPGLLSRLIDKAHKPL